MISPKIKTLCAVVLLILSLCVTFGSFACSKNVTADKGPFTVTYIDVGEGDSCYINYPNGKGLLIDAGIKNNSIYKSICRIIDANGGLNYLLITHPDSDHIGNAQKLVENYNIERVYLPYIIERRNFTLYSNFIDLLIAENIETVYFDSNLYWKEGDCLTSFLTPLPSGLENSSLDLLNLQTLPTDKQINDVSPIIYMEYLGVRFLFTGDASSSQEKIAIDNYLGGEYLGVRPKENLSEIDFLKVGHHGANDSTSDYFLSTVKPKNAIISVGADNFSSHPSVEVIDRLTVCRKDIDIYRTDLFGDITVTVAKDGRVGVSCSKIG